ncbi:MAG: YiiD C-terminal domain-containing protein [Kiritimatiellae bacterium]|nr:YiiD C-terminal domain-containing protein [Kiritimatiellia bacterium]
MLNVEEIKKIFLEQIPLVGRQMKIDVMKADDMEVVLSLPIEGNDNDKGTMFAGASYSALAVAGWCLAMNRAYKCGFTKPWAAITDAHCTYKKAIREDSVIKAVFKEEAHPVAGERNWLKVSASIGDAVFFEGTYAVGERKEIKCEK